MVRASSSSLLAPIALFTFKRPWHTQETLNSLATNPGFSQSPLFVFCDGARNAADVLSVNESREVVHAFPHPVKIVIESQRNLGLANSVIAGVTRLCNEYGRVIVIEDDLVVSPVFLDYLNAALDRYANEERVYQVTGHMWPLNVECKHDAFFLPVTSSLGWGTWQRAWARFDSDSCLWPAIAGDQRRRRQFNLDGRFPFSGMLEKQLRGEVDSWAIRWYLTVFAHEGLALYPKNSLLVNIGFDAAGTHSKSVDQERYGSLFSDKPIVDYPPVEIDASACDSVYRFLGRENSTLRRIYRKASSILARFS